MCRFPHLGWIYKSVSCHYKENSVRGQLKNDINYQEKKSWIFTFWLEIPTLPWCCSHSSLVSLVSGEVATAGKRKLCISGKNNCSHAISLWGCQKTSTFQKQLQSCHRCLRYLPKHINFFLTWAFTRDVAERIEGEEVTEGENFWNHQVWNVIIFCL